MMEMVTTQLTSMLLIYLRFGASSVVNGKPNILILLADDVGIGDIGCYGNSTISTPNIDKISKKGVKLNHNLAAAPVCTPSRAAILSGRYPVRFGYVSHSEKERRVTVMTSASGGLPPEEITFAEVLKDNGYSNGYFGKWHLGVHCQQKDFCHHPLSNGFDYFYGLPLTHFMDCGPWSFLSLQSELLKFTELTRFYMSIVVLCYTYLFVKIAHKPLMLTAILILFCWYFQNIFFFFLYRQTNCVVMRGYDIVKQPYEPSFLTEDTVNEAKQFVRRNRDRPFLAYVAFHHAHTATVAGKKFAGKSRHGSYGDTIEELDWGVGEMIRELDQLGILNNTLVYFSSDHGPARGMVDEITGEDVGGWSGIYRGSKGNNFEGGIRVPTLIQWPGVFRANTVIDRVTSHLDLFPTLLSLVNITVDTSNLDGIDISNLVRSNGWSTEDRTLFHYCGSNLHAMTLESQGYQIWKVHFVLPKYATGTNHCFGDDVIILYNPIVYDLKRNPNESFPLDTDTSEYKRVLDKAYTLVEEHKESLPAVPSQLTKEKNTFSFQRIECCHYPFCYC